MKTCCLCGITENRITEEPDYKRHIEKIFSNIHHLVPEPWYFTPRFFTDGRYVCVSCSHDYEFDRDKIQAAAEEIEKTDREEFGTKVLTEDVEKAYVQIREVLDSYTEHDYHTTLAFDKIKKIIETTILRRTK